MEDTTATDGVGSYGNNYLITVSSPDFFNTSLTQVYTKKLGNKLSWSANSNTAMDSTIVNMQTAEEEGYNTGLPMLNDFYVTNSGADQLDGLGATAMTKNIQNLSIAYADEEVAPECQHENKVAIGEAKDATCT